MKVVIIGGVAGGATTAARLRRLDEKAEIIIFERGEFVSFANCGLPYYIGDEITEKEALLVSSPKTLKDRYNIDARVFSEVYKIDKENKKVYVRNLSSNIEYEESYDKLVLSPGASPIKPNIEGIDSDKVFTLRNIPDTFKIKEYINNNNVKKVAVIGGGFIGIEMAENIAKLGINVTVIELSDHLIGPLDKDVSIFVKEYIESKGINVILNNGVTKIEDNDNLNIILNQGNLEVDMVILSIGVKPESKLAIEAGIEVNSRGSVIVNSNMETSDKNIYALGDVIEINNFVTNTKGFIPLAGPANKQGRIVADNIVGIKSEYKGTQGSSIIKLFDMTIASTGINETMAKSLNLDYDTVFLTPSSHASYYPNSSAINMKVVFEKITGRILGAQLVGFEGVDKRTDVIATAIRANMTASDLTELELCYAPPYSSAKDPVNMAGYVIENILTNKIKNIHYEDIKNNINNKDIIILDVRTKKEFERGNVENSINIPVDELRNRVNELDKSKEIYVYCHSGLRSYIASKILNNLNFNTSNLSGGFYLYNKIDNN